MAYILASLKDAAASPAGLLRAPCSSLISQALEKDAGEALFLLVGY